MGHMKATLLSRDNYKNYSYFSFHRPDILQSQQTHKRVRQSLKSTVLQEHKYQSDLKGNVSNCPVGQNVMLRYNRSFNHNMYKAVDNDYMLSKKNQEESARFNISSLQINLNLEEEKTVDEDTDHFVKENNLKFLKYCIILTL